MSPTMAACRPALADMAYPNFQSHVVIRPYEPADAESLMQHLQKCFRLESPVFSGLDMSEEESAPFFQTLIEEAEKADISYVACVHETAKTKPAIIGCVLASILDFEGSRKAPASVPITTSKQKAFHDFVHLMFEGSLKNLSMARVMRLDVLSVAPVFRRRQLCKKMVEFCIEDAVVLQSCDVALVLATSQKSQALMANEKFTTVQLCYFDDFNRRLKEGKHKFEMKESRNLSAKVMAKVLAL